MAPDRKRESFFVSEEEAAGKREILAAALRLFARRGLDGTSIRDIAEASGYANPALYKHFAGKDELAYELFERCYRETMRRLAAALRGRSDFRGRVAALVGAYTATFDAYPEVAIYTNDNLSRFWPRVPPSMKRRTVITQTREMLLRGQEQGAVRAGDVEVLVVAIAGTLAQLGRMLFLGGLPGPAVRWNSKLERTFLAMARG